MSVAPILGLRRAIVTHLRADTAVTSTAVGSRIYGEKVPAQPTWPFVRYGVSDAQPGFDISVPIHIFSKDDFTDDVNGIAERIGNSLDDKVLTLGDGRRAFPVWAGVRLAGDADEASAWHSTVLFDVRVPRDCA
jgi:hypothetical protein